jgi:CMP-N,N'-diacetyllegionaminic acid synthase
MNILAIIPARGGSKGVPRKNVIRIAGKPLIAWTIEAAKRSRTINRIVVTSDDPEILAVSKRYGAETIVRPKRYASDTAPTSVAVAHALEHLRMKERYVPDVIVLLQPTSPLRTARDIDRAVGMLKTRAIQAVVSVAETDNKVLKSFFMNRGFVSGIAGDSFLPMRRQSLPKIYLANGALFVIRTAEFLKYKRFISPGKTLGYVMGKGSSIDLDSREDIPALARELKRLQGAQKTKRK